MRWRIRLGSVLEGILAFGFSVMLWWAVAFAAVHLS